MLRYAFSWNAAGAEKALLYVSDNSSEHELQLWDTLLLSLLTDHSDRCSALMFLEQHALTLVKKASVPQRVPMLQKAFSVLENMLMTTEEPLPSQHEQHNFQAGRFLVQDS